MSVGVQQLLKGVTEAEVRIKNGLVYGMTTTEMERRTHADAPLETVFCLMPITDIGIEEINKYIFFL